jgi:hypothetical protein
VPFNSKCTKWVGALAALVIIGILMTPSGGARRSRLFAKGVKTGSDGRQIMLGLYASNVERLQAHEPEVWPRSSQFSSSTEFFREALRSGLLDGFTSGDFGGVGLPRPKGTNIEDLTWENNAWCITCDLGEGTSPSTPLLFTRNFVGGPTLVDIRGFSSTEFPGLKDDLGVVVTFGGSVRVIRDQDFRGSPERLQQLLNPNRATNSFLRP